MNTAQDQNHLYKIGEIAKILKVSIGTLRRWEREGKLTSTRTAGGHRRYSLEEIKLIKVKKEVEGVKPAVNYESRIKNYELPAAPLFPVQPVNFKFRKFFKIGLIGLILYGLIFTVSKANLIYRLGDVLPEDFKNNVAEVVDRYGLTDYINKLEPSFDTKYLILNTQYSPSVLAESVSKDLSFDVNINTNLKSDLSVGGNATISGTLTAGNLDTNGNLTSQSITSGPVRGTTGTFTGAVTTGALTTGNVTTNGTLSVSGTSTLTGDVTASGKLTVSGTSKLTGDVTASGVLTVSGATTLSSTLAVSGNSTFGNITKVNGVTYSFPTSGGTASTFLVNDGSGNLTWGTLAGTTGVLPIVNGGTNNSTAYTAGSVIFSNGTKLTQDNSKFFWDDTNFRLGIGTTAPTRSLDVQGAVNLGSATTDLITFTGRVTSGTSLIPAVNLGSDLGSSTNRFNNLYVGTVNSNSTLSTTGQALFTYSPTDTTYSQSSVMINPTTAPVDSNLLGIGIAGAQRAGIDAEGDLTLGYAGIAGSSVPTATNPLAIYNHGTTELMRVQSTGEVGIGVTNPSKTLEVHGDSLIKGSTTTSDAFIVQTSGGTELLKIRGFGDAALTQGGPLYIGGLSSPTFISNGRFGLRSNQSVGTTFFYVQNNDSTVVMEAKTNSDLLLQENASTVGNIGIGTTAPVGKLTMSSAVTGKALAIFDETGDQALFTASASGVSKVIIDHSGNVGIGVTNPARRLELFDSTTGIPLRIGAGAGDTAFEMVANNTAYEAMRVQSASGGNWLIANSVISVAAGLPAVGIGKTSGVLATLEVAGNVNESDILRISSDNTAGNSGNRLTIQRVSGNVGMGTSSPVSKLHLTGAVTGKALAIFDETGDQALFTASASGTPTFTIAHNGTVSVGATGTNATMSFPNTTSGFASGFATNFASNLFTITGASTLISMTQNGTRINSSLGDNIFVDLGSHVTTFNGSSGVEDMRLNGSTGNFGIGTNNPLNRLDVSDSQATASAMIRNTGTASAISGLGIKLSSTTLTTASHFIDFLDLNGTIIGKVQAANTTSVNYAANGTDMAEYFTKDSSVFTPGDLVSQGTNGATLTTAQYDSKMIGIVSTAPSFTGGVEGPNKVLVALVGQVPVKISSTSQPIQAGDYITSSSEAGKAMKAINPGYTIGKALEGWDPPSTSSGFGKTTINVAIHNSYFEGDLSGQIAQLKTDVANLTTDISLLKLSTSSATVATDSATFKDLTVLGNTVLADTVVNGKLNIGAMIFDNVNNSIDVPGTLKLQSRALGAIEFQGGNLIIDQSGNINIKKGVIMGNSSFRGSVAIKAGTTSAQVTQTTPWNNIPASITVTASYNTNVWVTNKTTTGFTINVSTSPPSDQSVDWMAIW